MRKLCSIVLALALTLSASAVAFAEGASGDQEAVPSSYEDMETVTLTKTYQLTNPGTESPAETFTFSALECTEVTDAADGVTTANAPVPSIASVTYAAGEAGSNTATKTVLITLPTYTSVGIYTYTFSENDNNTAGVTYRTTPIRLVVTVIEQDNKIRVAALHTENEDGDKSADFDNTYSAGSLSVTKQVTGLLGDQNKEFTVTVNFAAPAGDKVYSDIHYTKGGVDYTIAGDGWITNSVDITLKHNEKITFTNIPYNVTYTVTEADYSSQGYTPTYTFGDTNKTIDSTADTVTITNQKDGIVDMGVTVDSLPYVLLLVMVCGGMFLLITKKRMIQD